jgi:hypothetical protein
MPFPCDERAIAFSPQGNLFLVGVASGRDSLTDKNYVT